MSTIEIDFDVYKALTNLRTSESVTYNDVLRNLLKLPPKERGAASNGNDARFTRGDWIVKSVRFPEGTEFRATHKGRTIVGRVERESLVVNGERYPSPSAAAVAITNTSVNGWRFWEARLPGQSEWQVIDAIRSRRPA